MRHLRGILPGAARQLTLDNQIFRLQPFGGISTYWRELEAGLEANAIRFDVVHSKPIVRIQPVYAPGSVFHSSYYRCALGRDSRTVTTVHDLIPERGLATSGGRALFIRYRRTLLRMSDAFICVSEQTKNDLLSMYPNECIHKPVYVAEHGNPRTSFIGREKPLPQPSPIEARERIFLFIGNRDGYKSFSVAIDAFALSGLAGEGYVLLCSGATFAPHEQALLRKLRLTNSVRWTGRLETRQLYQLYAGALALVYPSSYEGFGLPIVEAMTFGCIPLVANVDPMRSVVGDLMPTFSPGDAHALAKLMVEVVSPSRAKDISARACTRANHFRWSRSIGQHIALYRELGADVSPLEEGMHADSRSADASAPPELQI